MSKSVEELHAKLDELRKSGALNQHPSWERLAELDPNSFAYYSMRVRLDPEFGRKEFEKTRAERNSARAIDTRGIY